MNLAVSSIGWNSRDNEKIFEILKKNKITRIEGVLSKIDSWENLTINKIISYSEILNQNKISIPSIQSIFHNLNFESLNNKSIINHIIKVANFCKILNVGVIVFGSPSLRKKTKDISILTKIFKEIDIIVSDNNVKLCIEPNSKVYGGEYFYNLEEIIEFIDQGSFKSIKTMLDTHNSILEGGNPIEEVSKYFNYISHIHVSEYGLTPIKNTNLHKKLSIELKKNRYENIITLEVLNFDDIESDITNFCKIYG